MELNLVNKNFKILSSQELRWTVEKQRKLEQISNFISTIQEFQYPKVILEQYSLPSDLIAFIFISQWKYLENKSIVDLGCGTGRFTLPLRKYITKKVLGVDIDEISVKHMLQVAHKEKLEVDSLVTSIEFLEAFNWSKKFQTCIMNPPFGTKRRKIDFIFLIKAMTFASTIISIHKSNFRTRKRIFQMGGNNNMDVSIVSTVEFSLLPSMIFHHKEKHIVRIDIFRILKTNV